MLETLLHVVAASLIFTGLTLATVALYGLLRMTEVYAQLHAAGLVTGPALIVILLAAPASGEIEIMTSAALVLVFVVVTAPVSAHAIARATYRRDAHEHGPENDPE